MRVKLQVKGIKK